jgi:glycosyltransferase involved in cell wall biosynthesis
VQGQSRTVALVSDAAEFGGAERYAVMLVEALRAECGFVTVVGDAAPAETRRRLSDAGAAVEVVRGLRRRPTLRALARLRRAIHAAAPDVVHVNATDQGDSLAPLLAARPLRAPAVLTLHLVVPGRSAWRERVSRWSCRRVRLAIAVSDAVAEWLDDAGVARVVIRNGVSLPAASGDARAALDVAPDAFLVGGVGRLDEQKGWDVLCEAAAAVRTVLPNAVFVVVGGGAELRSLQDRPACAHVRFAGYREDAAALVAAFDVAVVPSRYEGFGFAAAEAMLAGVPVVASRTGGLVEVVGDSGILVPPEDPAALAEAIVRLGRDDARRRELAAAGRHRAAAEFGVRRMAEQTLAVYQRVEAGG